MSDFFRERLRGMLVRRSLPAMEIDLGTYRRLRAMQARLIREDPSLDDEDDRGFEAVIYAAICGGLVESERVAGVVYDETSGKQLA